MAPPADERSISRVAALLLPFPGRAEFALRLALVCALTTLVVQIYQTPEPALTIYVAFFVVKPDRVTSVMLSVVMALLMATILVGVLLVCMAALDWPLWRLAAIAVLSFLLLFAASASKLKPVGSIVALIAGYALDVIGTAHIGEVVTRGLLYAWLLVGIPAGASIIVNLLIGPAPRRLAERALAHRLQLAASVLRGSSKRTRDAFAECLCEGSGEIPGWLRLAGLERTSAAGDLAVLAEAAHSACALLSLVDLVVDHSDPDMESRHALARCLDQMAGIFKDGGYPLDITFEPRLQTGASAGAVAGLEAIRNVLDKFAVAPAAEPKVAVNTKGGFFVADAFTNPVHTQYALKTTAAAMFCYVSYSLLDWPGIHTAFITCYIVSLATAGETIEKLTLRIIGCLIGAAFGIGAIVFVMINVTSIGALMAIVASVAFVSAWIAAGSARISYVGFQIAFAFFLSVVQGAGPEFDMTFARDRVVGILFGNLMVAVIFTQVWPVTVADRIDPAIVALLRKLASLARPAGTSQGNWAGTAEAQMAIGAVDQDIALTRYEPASIRPAESWTACRERIVAALAGCLGPLLLARGPYRPASVAERLDRLADALERGHPVQRSDPKNAPRRDDAGLQLGADHLVSASLRRLEQAVACAAPDNAAGGPDYVSA